MRITIESGTPDEPVSLITPDRTPQTAAQALDAGPAPVGLTESGGLVQEPPAFTASPAAESGGALSAGAAPAEAEVGP